MVGLAIILTVAVLVSEVAPVEEFVQTALKVVFEVIGFEITDPEVPVGDKGTSPCFIVQELAPVELQEIFEVPFDETDVGFALNASNVTVVTSTVTGLLVAEFPLLFVQLVTNVVLALRFPEDVSENEVSIENVDVAGRRSVPIFFVVVQKSALVVFKVRYATPPGETDVLFELKSIVMPVTMADDNCTLLKSIQPTTLEPQANPERLFSLDESETP